MTKLDRATLIRVFSSAFVTLVGVAVLLAAFLMSGCNLKQYIKREPIPSQCNAICYTPCVGEDGDTGIKWVGSYTDPAMWDKLNKDVLFPLVQKLRVCDTRRDACVQCLNRLEEQKVIVQ